MKIARIEKDNQSNVTRQFIAKFGEIIYQNKDVRAIAIKVEFKDGSAISFKRDEDEDDFEMFKKEIEKDEDSV